MSGADKLPAIPRVSPGAKIQRENLLRLPHAAQCVAAKRLEPSVGGARSGDELGGDEHRAAQRLAQRLDARDLVDRGADDGEIEPVGRADIAVEHLAEMEREIDGGERRAGAARAER